MTEDQYQQLRGFIKYSGKYISPDQLQQLKDVSTEAKNIRNRVFYWKQQVIDATRSHERFDTDKTKGWMDNVMIELKRVKKEFAEFFFDTSANN